MGKCMKCEGCGRIANDDDGTPWTYWENLPLKSGLAVMAGLVRPQPCPACNGTGEQTDGGHPPSPKLRRDGVGEKPGEGGQ